MIKKVLIAFAVLISLPIVAAIVMVAVGVEFEDTNPEKTAELYAKVSGRLAVLDEIAQSDEKGWQAEKACPDGLFEPGDKIEVLSYQQVRNYLRFKFDQTLAANDSIYDLVSLKLTSSDYRVKDSTPRVTLESIVSGGGLNDGHLGTIYAAKTLAVIRSEAFVEPKTGTKFTGQFHGGSYQGSVRLVDVETKETVCQMPFLVQSSNQIEKGFLSGGADGAIRSDFEKQMAAGKKNLETRLGGAPLAW
ncbi:MAG: hypothetical protein AAF219_07700 [Myxococcota bacterium]